MPGSGEDAKAVVKGYWDHGVKGAIKGELSALSSTINAAPMNAAYL